MKTIILDEIDSTNNYAKEIASKTKEDTLIIANRQTKGRGQFDRVWYSCENESITCSYLIFSKLNITDTFSKDVASYISNIINKKYDLNTYIKKPNDIYINNKKLAGILIETKYLENKLLYVIIGIGININQKNFPKEIKTTATSIFLETGKTFDVHKVLNYINDNFYKEFILKE